MVSWWGHVVNWFRQNEPVVLSFFAVIAFSLISYYLITTIARRWGSTAADLSGEGVLRPPSQP